MACNSSFGKSDRHEGSRDSGCARVWRLSRFVVELVSSKQLSTLLNDLWSSDRSSRSRWSSAIKAVFCRCCSLSAVRRSSIWLWKSLSSLVTEWLGTTIMMDAGGESRDIAVPSVVTVAPLSPLASVDRNVDAILCFEGDLRRKPPGSEPDGALGAKPPVLCAVTVSYTHLTLPTKRIV